MALLREVCAGVLATGECDPEPDSERSAFLVAWCVRMLVEPGAAERAVAAVERATAPIGRCD